ncbi:hypothetical protein D9M69_613840 [compost metagenome]
MVRMDDKAALQVAQPLFTGQRVLVGRVADAHQGVGQRQRPGIGRLSAQGLDQFPRLVVTTLGESSRGDRDGHHHVARAQQLAHPRLAQHEGGEWTRPAGLAPELETGDQPVPRVGVVHRSHQGVQVMSVRALAP